jgi:hypothetical protein
MNVRSVRSVKSVRSVRLENDRNLCVCILPVSVSVFVSVLGVNMLFAGVSESVRDYLIILI